MDLLQRFTPLAGRLLGREVLPSATQYALLLDTSGWHTDTGHAVPSLKVAVYFDELREYLASEFVPGMTLDYDLAHYPHFGGLFRDYCPPRWVSQLDRLGALAAGA